MAPVIIQKASEDYTRSYGCFILGTTLVKVESSHFVRAYQDRTAHFNAKIGKLLQKIANWATQVQDLVHRQSKFADLQLIVVFFQEIKIIGLVRFFCAMILVASEKDLPKCIAAQLVFQYFRIEISC